MAAEPLTIQWLPRCPHQASLVKGLHDFFAVRWRIRKESILSNAMFKVFHQQGKQDGNGPVLFLVKTHFREQVAHALHVPRTNCLSSLAHFSSVNG